MADDTGISLSPTVLALLLSAAGLGGGGLMGVAGPHLDKQALEQCYDNSETALAVAAQHGQELLDLRQLIYDRSNARYTLNDAARDWKDQDKINSQAEREIRLLRQRIDALENR
jgi:hypothetical protein